MVWHTIQEAQKLTGKSRRTLYRDMAAGRLSWVPEGDSARRLETSELIRAYGALLPVTQPEKQKTAQVGTDSGTQDIALVLAELKALREEVSELRHVMRLLEHKPDQVPSDTPSKTAQDVKPLSWWRSLFPRQGD
ncbi:entry exclusion protein 1 [Pseudomonas paracarnis]|uniref:entry exclusion protein 1 n=1 Tax=Pseudomonas paracarnis TaxID=2750625 RepID=UPI00191A4B8D|nr:entry exclusion protein 1 [Pseudomonas paracarnis]